MSHSGSLLQIQSQKGEKSTSVSAVQQQTPVFSQSAPMLLRSTLECPLLIDAEQRAAAEYFAVLRARLLKACDKSGFRSVLISSPQQRDGKTFTSINLALSLAQLEQVRVLLVDGDMRVKGTTAGLRLESEIGLADYLQQCAAYEDCVRATSLSHLQIVPAGNVLGESLPGILQGAFWHDFMERSKQTFDLVIVDSVPATAPIADFELLLNACEAALLVVHVRKTRRAAIESVGDRMQGKLLGVILNNQDLQENFSYGDS